MFVEVKKDVSAHLATMNDKHLAQTLVEGYYLMKAGENDKIVVVITSLAVSYFFGVEIHRNISSACVFQHQK